jgi:hypothetical protein
MDLIQSMYMSSRNYSIRNFSICEFNVKRNYRELNTRKVNIWSGSEAGTSQSQIKITWSQHKASDSVPYLFLYSCTRSFLDVTFCIFYIIYNSREYDVKKYLYLCFLRDVVYLTTNTHKKQ